jgi:hypothetical protein
MDGGLLARLGSFSTSQLKALPVLTHCVLQIFEVDAQALAFDHELLNPFFE